MSKFDLRNSKWLFFDLGYTLIDEDKVWQDRISQNINKCKDISYDDLYKEICKASREYLPPYMTAITKIGLEKQAWNKELEELYPQVAEMLLRLSKNYKLGIIANQQLGTAQRLDNWDIAKYFDVCLFSAEEGIGKPDLQIFQRAMKLANCNANDAVMIGDRLDNDVYPAKKLGMKTIWIRQGFGGLQEPITKEYQSDFDVANLSELLNLFVD